MSGDVTLNNNLYSLIRLGVFGLKVPGDFALAATEWDELMTLSQSQGVLGWVWDGIEQLLPQQQPHRRQKISWGLSAEEIRNEYQKKKEVLEHILLQCKQHNIRLLLFKGMAVSDFYPKPESRSFGDIDFYLFDDYELGNELFAKVNVSTTNKRTGFDFEGVHIENHRLFLNPYTRWHRRAIKYLEGELKYISYSNSGYYVMSPIATIVYQVLHFAVHLDDEDSTVSYRFIVDFAVTLHRYREEVSPSKLLGVLRSLGIEKIFYLMLRTIEDTLGFSYQHFQYKSIPLADVQSMKDLMFNRNDEHHSLVCVGLKEKLHYFVLLDKSRARLYKYLPKSRHSYRKHYVVELFSLCARGIIRVPNGVSVKAYLMKR